MEINFFRLFICLVFLINNTVSYSQKFEWGSDLGSFNDEMNNWVKTIPDNKGNVFVATRQDWNGRVLLQKFNSNGAIVWTKTIINEGINTGNAYFNAINYDKFGNIYLGGSFSGTCDFKAGVGVVDLLITDAWNRKISGAYVLKLDSNGNYLWAKGFNSFAPAEVQSLDIDSLGKLYMTGNFHSRIDLNPSSDSLYKTPTGNSSFFIVKLNDSGLLEWAKTVDAKSNTTWSRIIKVSNLGKVYVSGYMQSDTIDIDPGSSSYYVYPQSNSGTSTSFFIALDSNGSFEKGWNFPYSISSIKVLDNGSILTTGYIYGVRDFDPSINVHYSRNKTESAYVAMYDSSCLFKWVRTFGNTFSNTFAIETDKFGNIYTAGSFKDSADFDVGYGLYKLKSNGEADMFINKMNSGGDFIWAKSAGSILYNDVVKNIGVDERGNVFISGFYQNNFNDTMMLDSIKMSSKGSTFVARISQDKCSDVSIIIDSTSNVSCGQSGLIKVHTSGGDFPINYIWNSIPISTDSTFGTTKSGVYTVTATDAQGCTKNRSIKIDGAKYPSDYDITCFFYGGSFRPGVRQTISLCAINDGCLPKNCKLKLILPSTVNLNSSTNQPIIKGDTIEWNIYNLTYDNSFCSTLGITPNIALNVGSVICFKVEVSPINGDIDSSNNKKQYCFPIVNSFDPNDKQVYPNEVCNTNYILPNQILTYTLRFQNTGNASAINIKILDTLSSSLDISTFRILEKSHENFITTVLSSNTLVFSCDNIMLPDSAIDEAGSHGFITYEIKPLPNILTGSSIKNVADIYFDYNEPIKTNTVINRVIDILPTCTSSGFERTLQTNYGDIFLYPNPGTSILFVQSNVEIDEISIYNYCGQVVKKKVNASESNEINVIDLEAGIYLVEVKTKYGFSRAKWFKNSN